uniref:Erythropoietin n=1 Tax=Sinocyclocheilus rhinocerous TaxID=307959 RepID=A0A673K1L2_9TELE
VLRQVGCLFVCLGLVSVLIVFVWLGGNQVSPLRPICDLRVLEHFVREARDSEVIMRGCRGGCGAMKSYFVPLTSVDFAFWEHIDVHEQAVEVQTGLSLLVQALSTAMKAMSNSRLANALDNNISNIHSLSQILHSLDLQVHRNFQSGVLRQVGAKLCRTPALQDRVWTALV